MYASWLFVCALLCGISEGYRIPWIRPRKEITHKKMTNPVTTSTTDMPFYYNEPTKPVNERYPYAVTFGTVCGGTIIHPKWILTAAHCTLQPGVLMVHAGSNNFNDTHGVVRAVKRKIIHPLFSIGPYWLDSGEFGIKQIAARYDFLMVELAEPLPINGKTIAVAELYEQDCIPVGLKTAYAGYGSTSFKGVMRNEMHEVKLMVESNKNCAHLPQFSRLDMICAVGRLPQMDSACNGDSGSGLVDDRGQLIGVLSWAENDAIECNSGALVFFSRVSKVRKWIKGILQLY